MKIYMQENTSKSEIGLRFKSIRVERGVSQQNMADILNISRSNYSQIELGKQYPSFETIAIFSSYYSKTYEWILHGEERNHQLSLSEPTGAAVFDPKSVRFPKINSKEKRTVVVLKHQHCEYSNNSKNVHFLNTLTPFEIPKSLFEQSDDFFYRAFTAAESNRNLTINEDDVIIAKYINKFTDLIFNNIFVIVRDTGILVCRLVDFIPISQVFLSRDNDNNQQISTIKLSDIKEMWMATGVYSIRSTPLVNNLSKQIDKFEEVLSSLQGEIQQLKKLLNV